jgi:hypothetical protein
VNEEVDAIVIEDGPAGPTDGDGPPSATRPRHGRARAIIAAVLGALAVILLIVSVVGVWAKATVLRSEPVANLVGAAIAEPDVQAALAALLADEVQDAVDLENTLASALPSPVNRFAGPIAAGANAALERAFERLLARPATQQAVETIVERAHGRAMQLLRGDGLLDGVNVVNGEVSINLLPLVAQGLTALQSLGLLDDVTVPELTADGDPTAQVAELSAALGRDLPAGFGQLAVYSSDNVKQSQAAVETAQDLLVLAQRALWLVVLLAVVLTAATILVAPRRLRAGILLALAVAGAMVLLRASVREVVSQAAALATTAGAKAASNAIIGGAGNGLKRLAGVLLIISLLVVTALVLYRRRWRDDLVVVAAVLVGVLTVALLGVNVWSLVTGLLLGIAIAIAAHWALPVRRATPQPTVVVP